jgi:probable rRNA maturation factor
MLDVEVFGADLAPAAPPPSEVRRLCALAAAGVGVQDGHLAIEYVDERRIAQLNAEHRGKTGPTDVLSFPIDGAAERNGTERELGDVVICPAHTSDLREAIVHGVLHLVGFDHETDDGEMLALQAQLLADRKSSGSPIAGEGR